MKTPTPRGRWLALFALTLGVAASVVANILHARHNLISQGISAWPPIALLLTVELMARVAVVRRLRAWVRITATTAVAGIAAWASYWHMAAVASTYGEVGPTVYLLPLSVDGLIVAASVTLIEIGARVVVDPARTQVDATPQTVEEKERAAAAALVDYLDAKGKKGHRDPVRELMRVGADKAGKLVAQAKGNGNVERG